jgi:hypothetical protein
MLRITGTPKDLAAVIIQRLLALPQDKHYVLECKQKSQRSIEQNKLLWYNIQLASKEMGQDIWDTYCNLLEEADVKSDFVITAFEMADELRKSFRGVRFMKTQVVNGKDCFVYKVYIGSSKMTIGEMTELLERSYDLLENLGINYQRMEDL